MLQVRHLHKTYRLGRVDVPVLRGLSLGVERGEWVAVLGASGSGKSTLLHLVAGLDRPDRAVHTAPCAKCGHDLTGLRINRCPRCKAVAPLTQLKASGVWFDGRHVDDLPPRALDRYRAQSVGLVFQFYHLLPELTVLENVLMGAMVRHGRLGYRARAGGLRKRAHKLLDSFGLSERLRHRPAELSGGERQRVAIARALINEPPLLLADEPTGNLDQSTGEAILEALQVVRSELGQTIVMVTHDRGVAARADRTVTLVDGRVVDGVAPEDPLTV